MLTLLGGLTLLLTDHPRELGEALLRDTAVYVPLYFCVSIPTWYASTPLSLSARVPPGGSVCISRRVVVHREGRAS